MGSQNKAGVSARSASRGWRADDAFAGTEKLTKIKPGLGGKKSPESKDVSSTSGRRWSKPSPVAEAVAIDVDDGVEKLTDDEVKAIFKECAEPKAAEKTPDKK